MVSITDLTHNWSVTGGSSAFGMKAIAAVVHADWCCQGHCHQGSAVYDEETALAYGQGALLQSAAVTDSTAPALPYELLLHFIVKVEHLWKHNDTEHLSSKVWRKRADDVAVLLVC